MTGKMLLVSTQPSSVSRYVREAVAQAHKVIYEHSMHLFVRPEQVHELILVHPYSLILSESDLPAYPQYLEAGNKFKHDGRSGLFLLENSIRDKYSNNNETPVIFFNFQGGAEVEEQIRRYPPVSIYTTAAFGRRPLETAVQMKDEIKSAMIPKALAHLFAD
ncbi:MAG: hypothetical protein HYX24_07670 [Candidatus Aenigmarchaeota archaeon]|nr:hypothetical protein [Candidatus Aenigmarchaeota archaeon]